jgi:membrane-associated phospholipid phosphatase
MTAVAVFFVDVPLARACQRVDEGVIAAIGRILSVLELVILLDVPKYWLAGGLVLVGLVVWRWIRPALGRALVYVALTHLGTRLATTELKLLFERHRPREVPFDPRFFQPDGIAFPSGHGAYVAGIFFALLVVRPRLAWWFSPLLVAVMAARIVPCDHWLGDTLGAMVVAALVATVLWPIAPKR